MLLHFSDREISGLSLYDGAFLIDKANEIKDQLEIIIIASGGVINPAEIEKYNRYFKETETSEEISIEEDLKHFEEMTRVLAGINERQEN